MPILLTIMVMNIFVLNGCKTNSQTQYQVANSKRPLNDSEKNDGFFLTTTTNQSGNIQIEAVPFGSSKILDDSTVKCAVASDPADCLYEFYQIRKDILGNNREMLGRS